MNINLGNTVIDGLYLDKTDTLILDRNKVTGYDISGYSVINTKQSRFEDGLSLGGDNYYKVLTSVKASSYKVFGSNVCIKNNKVILLDTNYIKHLNTLNGLNMYTDFIGEVNNLSMEDKLKLLTYIGFTAT